MVEEHIIEEIRTTNTSVKIEAYIIRALRITDAGVTIEIYVIRELRATGVCVCVLRLKNTLLENYEPKVRVLR